MIGIGTCGPAAYAVWLLLGELKMQQEAKRYRAMRWIATHDEDNEQQNAIFKSLPDLDDSDPTASNEAFDAALDIAVAHLEANGVDLSS